MRRLDLRLVELGLAPTRSKAQQMIRAGEVEVLNQDGWRVATEVSRPTDRARLIDGARTLRYVSRGGFKLEGALDRVGLDVGGRSVLDLGLSTGGFSDCVLRRGAARVLGIDVGRGQLHESLVREPRLTAIEGLNARAFADHPMVRAWVAGGLDLIVADLSFISLTLVLPEVAAVAPPKARVLLLVKPQFETSAARLNRRGVVDDPPVFAEVEARVRTACAQNSIDVDLYFASEPKGQDGNQEFFLSGSRGP